MPEGEVEAEDMDGEEGVEEEAGEAESVGMVA